MYQPSRPQRTATWDPTGLDIHVLTNGRALTPTMLYSDPAALGWLAFSILEYFIGGKVTWRHAECERRAQRGIGSTGQVA
jgi:hypothetical protein